MCRENSFFLDTLGLVTDLVTVDGNRMAGKGPGLSPLDKVEPLGSNGLQFIGGMPTLQFIGDGPLLEILRSYTLVLSFG